MATDGHDDLTALLLRSVAAGDCIGRPTAMARLIAVILLLMPLAAFRHVLPKAALNLEETFDLKMKIETAR